MAGRKFQIGNVSLYTVKKGLFLSVCVDDIKLAGKKQNINPMWKVLNKEVDLGEPTSFFEIFAMKTDIPMNGSMVKNHISFKTVFGYSVTR